MTMEEKKCNCIHCRKFFTMDHNGKLIAFVKCKNYEETIEAFFCNKKCIGYEESNDAR